MYTYYSCLRFLPIKHNNEVKDIDKESLNNTPNLIKKISCQLYSVWFCYLHDKVLIHKREGVPPIAGYMIPVYF